MIERIRALAEVDAGELPLLSIYLDVRPEATGERPALRAGVVVMRDRLRDIRKTLLPRGAPLDSFDADVASIERYVEEAMSRSAEGVALFACNGVGLFEPIEVAAPFDNQVTAGRHADLYQLARFAEDFETSLVAVVDSNTARLFLYRRAGLREVTGVDDDPVHYQKRATGGWSQARYQRHIDKHRHDFAAEMSRAIEDLAEREAVRHIVLAGDEVAMTPLKEQLPHQLKDKIRSIQRIAIRAQRDEIADQVEPLLRQVEEASETALVDQFLGELRRGGLATSGDDAVAEALGRGQVDVLIVDARARLDPERRAKLVRQASLTAADVEVVEGHAALLDLGGVGALLRYRT